MNRRLTLLLVLVFGGLLTFSLFLNAVRRQSLITAATAANTVVSPQVDFLFPDVQPASITRIELRDLKAGTQLTLQKVPGDWKATDEKGASIAADLPGITRLIQILGTLRYNRVIMDQSLASYGLAGDGRVSIRFDAGGSHALKIGDSAQVSGLTYVQRDNDSAIYLVPSQTIDFVTRLLAGTPPKP